MWVSDALLDVSLCAGVSFKHVFREINQVADRLAKLGFRSGLVDWSNDLELAALIRKDAIGWRYSR